MGWWFRLFGPRGPEPVRRVDDPVFGPLMWSEDDEAQMRRGVLREFERGGAGPGVARRVRRQEVPGLRVRHIVAEPGAAQSALGGRDELIVFPIY